MIPVTKPYLPAKGALDELFSSIYERNWLTNNGPLLNEYELQLKRALGLDHLLQVANGTLALQIAIKALDLSGSEVITTPFSYVATTSSLVWENCKPVFADIDPKTLNIEPKSIEDKITNQTKAILATHCFGVSCDIDAIDKIASKHGLKVIYDASHCFGVKFNGKSVFEYGDISTLSLHATKLVHSVEGGAVISRDPDLIKTLSYIRNFGHDGTEAFFGLGINAKSSEYHAAVGLAVLKDAEQILKSRKEQHHYYLEILKNLKVSYQEVTNGCETNFSYFPIIFDSEEACLKSKVSLERQQIFPRRYFYPSLSSLPYVEDEPVNCKIANSISQRILCLPLYYGLAKEEQDLIARILLRTQNYG